LLFAESLGCTTGVNLVPEPVEFDIERLPADELRDVVAEMEGDTTPAPRPEPPRLGRTPHPAPTPPHRKGTRHRRLDPAALRRSRRRPLPRTRHGAAGSEAGGRCSPHRPGPRRSVGLGR
jgi:hypothetical protein